MTTTDYSQTERLARVDSMEPKLMLRRMTGSEALSELFELRLELCIDAKEAPVDFKKLVGSEITIAREAVDPQKKRYWNGIVSRFAMGEADEHFTYYYADVVPKLWLLTRTSNCRTWLEKSASDVIEDVLKERGISYSLDLKRTPRTRALCVQYRETDYQFICRLLEEEGAAFRFDHTDKDHKLVIFDQNPTASALKLAQGPDLSDLRFEREIPSGAFALMDFDYEKSSQRILSTVSARDPIGPAAELEIYDYPGEYKEQGDGDKLAELRCDAEEAAAIRYTARSAAPDLFPGMRITIDGDATFKGDRLVTRVTHSLTEGLSHDDDLGEHYQNHFSCIPADVAFRPLQLTPKPTIKGPQTATVVGPTVGDYDIDEQGRILVWFHWDRDGSVETESSARVRVSQGSAGSGWGTHFWPRIGQEVVVEFLDGDPDRPLVTGVVYNDDHEVPHRLPDNAHMSGFKTRTVGGGEADYNELRFKDEAGAEEVFLRAQKDQLNYVGDRELVTVEGESHHTYRADQRIDVGGNHDTGVGGEERMKVVGGYNLEAAKGQIKTSGDYAVDGGMNVHIKAGMNMVLEAGLKLSLKVGGNFVDISPAGVSVQGVLVNINSGGAAGSGGGSSPAAPEAPEEVESDH